jgi:hypothetical protein
MSTISITDTVGLVENLDIRDDSPLAKAKLTQLISTSEALLKDFTKPVDQTDISTASLGAQLTTPSSLITGAENLTLTGGVNCDLSVLTPTDKFLFAADGFSPTIPILPNQSWVGFEVNTNLGASLSAAADGFGVAVEGTAELAVTTFTLIETAAPPLPLLKDAIVSALEHFSVAVTAQSLRQQSPGTVNVTDLSGTVIITGSYSVPISVSPFASANLPFNFPASVAPVATVEIAGSLAIAGEFVVRSHKVSDGVLQFGVYKKKGTTLTASITAEAGVEGTVGDTDLLSKLLNAVLPAVDVSKAGIPEATAATLNGVIKQSLDRSIAVSLNATCSAATTHEAAILYEINLIQGDATKTDKALGSALKGDWTLITLLPNAKSLRNITVETKEQKRVLSLNLLGFYNATSVTDYVRTCTILHDENCQLTITDQVNASRVRAISTPYATDPDKLRTALAQDFITTATYAVVASRLNLQLTLVQDYFDYADKMNVQQFRQDLLLGSALGLFPEDEFSSVLGRNSLFLHARVSASLHYDTAAVMSIFFSDPESHFPRTQDQLESIGRATMASLIDPSGPVNPSRIAILSNAAAWAAMDSNGDTANFKFLPELAGLNEVQLSDVTVDWVSVRWWADTISKVAPQLAKTLAIIDGINATDPTTDPGFMKQRDSLATVLGAVSKQTKAAFVSTWGPAVIFALSGKHASIIMDVAWDSCTKHFERN